MIYSSGIHESCGIPNYDRKDKQAKTKDSRMHMTAQTCETNLDAANYGMRRKTSTFMQQFHIHRTKLAN